MNRTLIIAMGRSGGYNLGMWLSKEKNAQFIHEPVNNNSDESGYNVVTKYLITEWEEKPSKWRYDRIIGLIREGDRECAISQLWAEDSGEWRRGYQITDEWIHNNEGRIKDKEEWVKTKRESLLKIKGLNFVVSYEGIYERGNDIDRILKYCGLKGKQRFVHLLDSSNRLRKTDNQKSKRLI